MNSIIFPVNLMFLFTCLLAVCNCSSEKNSDNAEIENDLIKISQAQFLNQEMQTGKAINRQFEDVVKVNGFILAPTGGIAQAGAYIPGIISNIYFTLGKYVTKGQVLYSLSSKEIISLQQEYAEIAGRLNGLQTDYQRSKSLLDEKIGSQKDYIAIESEYKSALAKYEGLKSQLRLMNLDPKNTESGIISQSYQIYAPISGYITMQNCILGKYAEPNEVLVEIVDITQLQLQLSVFEKDISKLKTGQLVRFSVQDKKESVYSAELNSVGKSIDQESKTILCIANLKNEDCNKFVNRMFVEAEIITSVKNVPAVPNNAIVKSGEDYFVFILEKQDKDFYYLKKLKITTGSVSNGYTEISGSDSLNNLVLNGVYNLQVE